MNPFFFFFLRAKGVRNYFTEKHTWLTNMKNVQPVKTEVHFAEFFTHQIGKYKNRDKTV